MRGKLFVVGTPIGNLSDISPRGLETLQKVDFIAAEDTRVTAKLLNHFRIKKPLISYFEHNKREKGQIITDRILAGENCALVTDAGMPCISDPGEDLVRLCMDNEVEIESVPGPTAFATAIAISGMSAGRFTFEGFLSVNKQERKEHLESLKNEKRTMIFYEAPHKLKKTLSDFGKYFPDRQMAIVKELTKIHESVVIVNTNVAASLFDDREPRGEYVLILEAAKTDNKKEISPEQAKKLARELIDKGMSVNEAAKTVAAETGLKKSDIYKSLV